MRDQPEESGNMGDDLKFIPKCQCHHSLVTTPQGFSYLSDESMKIRWSLMPSEKRRKTDKCEGKYKNRLNRDKSKHRVWPKSHDVTSRRLVFSCLQAASIVIRPLASQSHARPPEESTYLCTYPKCMAGQDIPKAVSWATYKRHRKDRLKISSYANFLGSGRW